MHFLRIHTLLGIQAAMAATIVLEENVGGNPVQAKLYLSAANATLMYDTQL